MKVLAISVSYPVFQFSHMYVCYSILFDFSPVKLLTDIASLSRNGRRRDFLAFKKTLNVAHIKNTYIVGKKKEMR